MAWIIDVGAGKSLGIVFPLLADHRCELSLDERTALSESAARQVRAAEPVLRSDADRAALSRSAVRL